MNSAREIRSRVKSIKSTQKVTHAMEMISATKMRKFVAGVVALRPYALHARSILMNFSVAMRSYRHPLLVTRPVRRVLVVVVASNRGLCGGFNAQVLKRLKTFLSNEAEMGETRGIQEVSGESDRQGQSIEVSILAIGKKAERMADLTRKKLIASFPKVMHLPTIENIRPIAKMIREEYVLEKYDKVSVIYTDYISPVVQQAKIRQLLPISKDELEKQIAEIDTLGKNYGLTGPAFEYKVEPDPVRVLDILLPNILHMQLYHMILESSASKEAARMVAMKNATDAAKEIAEELLLMYNQIRQAKITQEIAEISAGRLVLEE